MSKPFKLSAALFGHSLDVRSVAVTSKNSILSGSRDKTTKLWFPNGFNAGFTDGITFKDQKNFVASVLYLENSPEYPDGVVITGGNDNLILVYKPHEPFASITFKEHTNAVCGLSTGLESNTFLSCSWDATAKLWDLNRPNAALVTFSGHMAAVWAVVQLQNSNVITASADKTIGVSSKDGFRINTIQGHTDCVRGLADFPELNHFISVSNDATIKIWSYAGANVDTYYGHTNYIYSIARNKAGGENCFVTSDEDRTVRYWKNGVNTEMIQLPAQSVWTLACLSNGDIVTGSSDSIVRVFTQDESRFASEEALKAFEEEVNALAQQSTQEIGGYKVSDLPGKEALYEPGKKAGQMKMIREPQGVIAYTWVEEGENSHWEKVGDVLGGADPNTEGKTTFEGKAYDFVFSVDVEDGKPPIKLPFNKGDDPYMAAHAFLEKNMLPAQYLDQVVEFILKNSKNPSEAPAGNSSFVDPFTGASRYTPAATSGPSTNSGLNLDPFTGSSSYSSGQASSSTSKPPSSNLGFFPQFAYRGFEQGNQTAILGKLREFNPKAGFATVRETSLENVVKLSAGSVTDENFYDTLSLLLNWGEDIIFPVLDIVRMAVRYEPNNSIIVARECGIIIKKLKYFISQDCKSQNCTLVAFRALCNMFMHPAGEKIVFNNKVGLLENVTSLTPGNKNIQIAMATFLLNMTISCQKKDDEFGIMLLASVIPDIIVNLEDPEAQFRALIAIGTLFSTGVGEHKKLVKEKIKENENFTKKLAHMIQNHSNDVELKRKNCAVQVLSEIGI